MLYVYAIAAIVAAVDQVTKAWVRAEFAPGETVPIFANVFHFTYVQNPGAAFGILKGQLGLVILVTAIMVALVVFNSRNIASSGPWVRAGLGLALGGGVGNLIDRLRFGWVTDFLDFRVWPVFNVADSAIFVGVCILLWHLVIVPPKPAEEGEGRV